jgi:hypothetical protein
MCLLQYTVQAVQHHFPQHFLNNIIMFRNDQYHFCLLILKFG